MIYLRGSIDFIFLVRRGKEVPGGSVIREQDGIFITIYVWTSRIQIFSFHRGQAELSCSGSCWHSLKLHLLRQKNAVDFDRAGKRALHDLHAQLLGYLEVLDYRLKFAWCDWLMSVLMSVKITLAVALLCWSDDCKCHVYCSLAGLRRSPVHVHCFRLQTSMSLSYPDSVNSCNLYLFAEMRPNFTSNLITDP